MLEDYTLKTDRNIQWKNIEALMIDHGGNRKNIKACKGYFFEGKGDGLKLRWSDRFKFYPSATLEGWQTLFDQEIIEPLTDSDYLTLQHYFCGQFSDYYFCIEDQSYYFKMAFGERYDKNKTFPIRINREHECRVITVTQNKILRNLMTNFSCYMKDIKANHAGFLKFNLGYLDSLLPFVSLEFFNIEASNDITEDGVRIGAVQSSTTKMLKWSYAKPSKKIDQERIDAANTVKEVFLKHADNLGEFNALHEKVRKDLKIKD